MFVGVIASVDVHNGVYTAVGDGGTLPVTTVRGDQISVLFTVANNVRLLSVGPD